MNENKNNTSGLNFPQQSNIVVNRTPIYYGVLKSDWKYLKDLINNSKQPFGWVEIIVSAFVSVGISILATVYTVESMPIIFTIIGYASIGVGTLGIVVCIYLRNIAKNSIDEIKNFFHHVDDTIIGGHEE